MYPDIQLQGVPAQYDFWDLEKIVLCEIRTSWDYIANSRNSTSTNFIPIALKLYQLNSYQWRPYQWGSPCIRIPHLQFRIFRDPIFHKQESCRALLYARYLEAALQRHRVLFSALFQKYVHVLLGQCGQIGPIQYSCYVWVPWDVKIKYLCQSRFAVRNGKKSS